MCKFIEFYNSKIKKMFVLKKVLRFSGFNLGVPAMPSGFPLYLCSPPPAPKSRPRFPSPSPLPVPVPNPTSLKTDSKSYRFFVGFCDFVIFLLSELRKKCPINA